MNKTELIKQVSNKTGLTRKDTGNIVDAVVEVITNSMKKGEKVTLVGFGTFQVLERKARIGRNPQTGEELQIPAKKVARFVVSKVLRGKRDIGEKRTFGGVGRKLDELARKVRGVAQDGVEKLTTQTRTLAQISKLKSQIRDIKRKREDRIVRLGKRTYEAELYKKIDNQDLKKIGEEIAKLEKEITIKKEEIQKLKK